MSAPRPLAGVLPVVQTPFAADGTVDEAALRREVDWVVDQGAHGVTTGMVSEILRMTSTECARLAEVVVEQARARGALSVVSCGAESTFGAVAAARHAEAVGADAAKVSKAAKSLQEVLGRFQDGVIAQEQLRDVEAGSVEEAFGLGALYGLEHCEAERARDEVEAAWSAARKRALRALG